MRHTPESSILPTYAFWQTFQPAPVRSAGNPPHSPETSPVRLGYFGGSFDPPHRAHLQVALLARQHFGLDRVLLAPAARQPLKAGGAEAPFPDRLRMVDLLCAGEPGLEASAIDGPRPGNRPNYTADTLRRLLVTFNLPATTGTPPELFAIVGADAFLGLHQWREPDALLELAKWIVISRPGFALPPLLPENWVATTSRSKDKPAGPLALTPAQRRRVHLLPGLEDTLSATELRTRLHRGLDCRDLIPAPVLAYLEDKCLYRE